MKHAVSQGRRNWKIKIQSFLSSSFRTSVMSLLNLLKRYISSRQTRADKGEQTKASRHMHAVNLLPTHMHTDRSIYTSDINKRDVT